MLDLVQVRITLGLHALRSAAFLRAPVLSCKQSWASYGQQVPRVP